LNELKESIYDQHRKELETKETEKNKIIKDLEGKLLDLDKKHEKLTYDYKEIKSENQRLDSSLQENSIIITNIKNESKIYKDELENLRNHNKNLDLTKFSQEKNISEYSIRFDLLQKQLEDKNIAMGNLNSLVDTLRSQKVT